MPRAPRETNAAELNIGQESSLILPPVGDIVRDDNTLVVADGPIDGDYASQLSFMEEKVEVMVHESTDDNAENPVQVSCNGVNQFFFRGQSQTAKRKFVEILARAKATSISTKELVMADGTRTTQIGKASALKYPFSIIQDSNPRGPAWLKAVLSEA